MIQRAVTAIIGVVIGLFATFAVFGSILGGLDNFYLLTQDTCNYGTANAPKRVVRVFAADDRTAQADQVDWSDGISLAKWTGDDGTCAIGGQLVVSDSDLTASTTYNTYFMTPNGDFIHLEIVTRSGVTTSNAPRTLAADAPLSDDLAVFYFGYESVTVTPSLSWITAEEVFTAQKQLVTLLAVIAALGMPIGAMTAVVFFGQAVVSSGVSGQGASQVLVAIAAVVVILVAVQMFEQFAGYLGDAFDAVDSNRFVVFNETLGTLAETISEFWGVLAFAGLINIATIVWRNYSGNFSIGGTGGGL